MCVDGILRETLLLTQENVDMRALWLRLVGSLELQVSFAKEPHKRDYVLQKRTMIVRRLLIVATP